MEIMSALKKVTSSIKEWVDENKVAKVSGKGLSTNDYTTADKNRVSNIPNDLIVLDGKLYLAQDGVVLDDSAVTLPSGGGSASAAVTITNNLASTIITSALGRDALLQFNYASSEDETGDGTAYVYVGDVLKMTSKISPGDNTINVGPYVSEGTNIVKLTCMDQYSNSRSLSYTVNVVSLKLTSVFDATIPYDGDISYFYTPVGDAVKTMHFILDEVEIDTVDVSTSGRQQTYIIPKKVHGSHLFEVYFTAEIGGEEVESNHLYYDLMFITEGETTPIISCAYNNKEMVQFDTIVIPYIVYSPASLTSDITIAATSGFSKQLTVDRTEQTWSFRADEYGEITLTISCGTITKSLSLNVIESEIDVNATTNDLELYLSSYGRSNNEENPATWEYNDISSVFTNFNFVSDGWQLDEDGISVLRVSGDARLEIPAKIFATDFKSTGKTIEVEFQAREVLNYESVIISCMSGNRGIQITAQRADLFSDKSTIGTQYKENEHIRISFVVEKKNENRFLLVYINGILSGAQVYTDDEFAQATNPVGITIGSNYCTTDVYCIRVYNNNLTRYQILDNWIADTQNGQLMLDRYSRNRVYNVYGDITIDKLPKDLPYLILRASALPQYKGDKKTCSGTYVDSMDPSKSFTFSNAQCDVQGTSSQYYYVKNYKIKFKNGFVNENGVVSDDYQLNSNSIPTNTFTFKADVASSEGANNVVLAQIYNDLCPTLTPPQKQDPRVRQTIDGHPIVIFWDDGNDIVFLGKYNFNNDKGTHEVFGFSEGDESWEIRENGTDLVGWKSDDFSGDWTTEFEARYPEDNTDITNLQALSTWLVSTNTEAATNEALVSPVTYDGVQYDTDSAEYRLAKFKAELADHADVDALVFYYLITEIALCIDQREKNAFPTLFAEDGKWLIFFYDADSSMGIDNKGKLQFSPYLEDIDYTDGGDPVYNGQASVLFVNLRKAFYSRTMQMYQQFRVDGVLSYDIMNEKFETHQSKWCEAIFNEDMYRKCLYPMISIQDGQYLPMLLGKKEMQRKWWLYNRFRYLDSKYITGSSMDTRIMIRAKSKANIWLTSYVNMYGHVYYNDAMVEHRMERGTPYEYVWNASGAEDAVIGINDADMLTSIGDLSGLQVETIDIALATHLTSLKIGDASSSYTNKNLTSVTFGNNTLLRSIDLRNCSALSTSIDVSGCTNIEEIYLDGTSIKGINLPNGGVLKTLHVPDTITNLTICNQPSLTDFVLSDSSNLTTLRLENVGSSIDALQLISKMSTSSRIRAIDLSWTVDTEEELVELFDRLAQMRGLDEYGNNTDLAVLSGRCYVNEKVSDAVISDIYSIFPNVTIDDGSENPYIITYKDWNGTTLYADRLADGEDAIDPIAEGYISAPSRAADEYYSYEFVGWSTLPTDVDRHYVITAQYKTLVAVNFAVDGEIIHTEYVNYGTHATDPVASGIIDTPTKEGTDYIRYEFDGWDGSLQNVTLPRTLNGIFANIYPIYFYPKMSALNPHYILWVKEGEAVYDPVAAGECDAPSDVIDGTNAKYVFSEWLDMPETATEWTCVYANYTTYYAVRFWNDSTLHFYEWVLKDETAVQPTEGMIGGDGTEYTVPDRVSTVQYDYGFSSWVGRNEATFDTVITEPVDFDAEYYSTLRKYNVEFYTGSQLLYTANNIQYGNSATYVGSTPTKTGVDNPDEYVFKGWSPEPAVTEANIKNDVVKCYALFKFTGYLFGKLAETEDADQGYGTVDSPNWDAINAYWETIGADSQAYIDGTMSQDDFRTKYPIGGRMLIQIALTEGTKIADVEVIGHDHDDMTDGTKAPLTFFCVDLPDIRHPMNTGSPGTNSGGWQASQMREFVSTELLTGLPTVLQDVIKPVNKLSDAGCDDSDGTIITTVDQCWLASYSEVGLSSDSEQGAHYSNIFDSSSNRKKYIMDSVSLGGWWLRSSVYYYNKTNTTAFYRITTTSGGVYTENSYSNYYVAFGFCI